MTAPRIPESVRRAIADPLVLGDQPAAKWVAPAELPPIADVRAGISILRADIEPAKAKDARWCLGKIRKRFGMVQDDAAREAWMTAHGKLPLDLWRKATLAALQQDQAPTVETFGEPVAAILAKRRIDLGRAEFIMTKITAPKPAAAFVPDPPEVRLRTLLRAAERRGDDVAAARYERELAVLEGREPAAWALPAPEVEIPTAPPPAQHRPSPTQEAALKRALARRWRTMPGGAARAALLDRQADALADRPPDVITDILEGAAA